MRDDNGVFETDTNKNNGKTNELCFLKNCKKRFVAAATVGLIALSITLAVNTEFRQKTFESIKNAKDKAVTKIEQVYNSIKSEKQKKVDGILAKADKAVQKNINFEFKNEDVSALQQLVIDNSSQSKKLNMSAEISNSNNVVIQSISDVVSNGSKVGEKSTTISFEKDSKGNIITNIDEVTKKDNEVVKSKNVTIDNITKIQAESESENYKFQFAQKMSDKMNDDLTKALTGTLLVNWDSLNSYQQKMLAKKNTKIVVDNLASASGVYAGADVVYTNQELFPSLTLGYLATDKNGKQIKCNFNVAFNIKDNTVRFAGLAAGISAQLNNSISAYVTGEITPNKDTFLDPSTIKASAGFRVGFGGVKAPLNGDSLVTQPSAYIPNKGGVTPSGGGEEIVIGYSSEPSLPNETSTINNGNVVNSSPVSDNAINNNTNSRPSYNPPVNNQTNTQNSTTNYNPELPNGLGNTNLL